MQGCKYGRHYSVAFLVEDKMDKRQKVQISKELFTALVKYHLLEMNEEQNLIKKELKEKLDLLVKRDIYTKYKTASTEEEKEEARQEYLDQVGMMQNFRW